ncbi:hypothetical protein DL89DRAFT_264172 [Linderina pennispora]|uniref:ABC transporter domain-containing protein n=1 Tax=Linderina pennispora TaxID=61395 RepID=A0A1Y1WMB8_9FUNG|nr:uncharacterized protein DL89DRAFT_264172 [Linderina pennispora]ORX74244.1 hypothetical protein DL89DRAFT_264172 [Linderina pennispora]
MVSLVVVLYSYIQHRQTAEKAKRSMSLSAALSTVSMRSMRGGGTYDSNQWTESDERERRFDKDAPFFPASLIDRGQGAKNSGKLNRTFFAQLRALTRIMVPSLASREMLIIAMHTVFLVLRTWLSVVVAELDGKIVKHLVRGHGRKFLAGLLSWFAIAIPATYTNSMIKFLESKLALAFRTRLTQYVHDLYLNDHLSYYKMLTLDGRISNPDQFITTDIARFCNKLASFLSNLGKPTLDTIIFNIQLIRGVGFHGTVGMFAMYMATASLLRAWTPAFGKMAASHAKLEGEFRANHARVITNAEEIAFYRGEKREEEQLQFSLTNLLEHARSVAKRKISHVVLEDMVIKYTWSAFGYLVCALPFFLRPAIGGGGSSGIGGGGDDGGFRTQSFITNKRILVNLSDAGGRMMYSIKEVMELTGYTSRVYSLISTLHAMRRDEYEKPEQTDDDEQPKLPEFSLADIRGVRRGQHWMIAGPNGVGKTSVLRVLSGLWPAFAGTEIIYIPQRPYLSLLGRTDEELMEVLHAVHLAYLPSREGGLGARKEWKDVLSGGEKQRINLARLFYHLPRFAVLDECTSAVSADVEGLMYEHAKRLGVTLITISHRPALYKYHTTSLSIHSISEESHPETETTESWETDMASSGVLWDVVQLSTDAGTTDSSQSSSPPDLSPQLGNASELALALSTIAGHEIEQLRRLLEAKRAQAASLQARLAAVQQELDVVTL